LCSTAPPLTHALRQPPRWACKALQPASRPQPSRRRSSLNRCTACLRGQVHLAVTPTVRFVRRTPLSLRPVWLHATGSTVQTVPVPLRTAPSITVRPRLLSKMALPASRAIVPARACFPHLVRLANSPQLRLGLKSKPPRATGSCRIWPEAQSHIWRAAQHRTQRARMWASPGIGSRLCNQRTAGLDLRTSWTQLPQVASNHVTSMRHRKSPAQLWKCSVWRPLARPLRRLTVCKTDPCMWMHAM
jgi:hypothetical protein